MTLGTRTSFDDLDVSLDWIADNLLALSSKHFRSLVSFGPGTFLRVPADTKNQSCCFLKCRKYLPCFMYMFLQVEGVTDNKSFAYVAAVRAACPCHSLFL
jgi:hypothetical protein